jgi:hypothetical protein
MPENPSQTTSNTDWLAWSYQKAVELHAAFETAQWSRSITRCDMREIGKLHSRSLNLMNTLYHATQAQKRLHDDATGSAGFPLSAIGN